MSGGEIFFHLRRENIFNEARTKFYAAEIILALDYLHRNKCIYRDLKPENVLLEDSGHLKLTDFGLSKWLSAGQKMSTSFVGTAEYLAPEIWLQKKSGHNHMVDYWSLGVMMFEMLSGNNPFKNRNMS
jgi:serine/threonine protein kinase